MKNFILFLILILAFALRFYKLGAVPKSLNWDENSNAYNAYSILKTGKDEFGNFFPLTNRSFDDYKPPLYMYLNIPSVAVFNLTPLAARLPSAIFGFLTVPFIYFLTKALFKKMESQNYEPIALVSALLFTVSPWHLQFSRVGFEATIGLFTTVAAITMLFYSFKKPSFLFLAAIFIGLSFYAYHAQRIFLPPFLIIFLYLYRKDFTNIPKKYLLTSAVILIAFLIPLFIFLPRGAALQRFQSSSLMLQQNTIEKSARYFSQDKGIFPKVSNLLHGQRSLLIQNYLQNYISNFDINFIFVKGDDNFRHHMEGMGLLYLFSLPLVLFGIYLLIKKLGKISLFIFAWLILAPLPSAPVTPAPHAIRSFLMVIPLTLLSAYAVVWILSQRTVIYKILTGVFAVWITISVGLYLHDYFIHYSESKASEWQYGYKESAIESEKLKNRFDKVRIHKSLEQAYIFWLFNTKYDPSTYQKYGTREHFDKYYFDVDAADYNSKELFISVPPNKGEIAPVFPKSFEIVKKIYLPDGEEAIRMGHAN